MQCGGSKHPQLNIIQNAIKFSSRHIISAGEQTSISSALPVSSILPEEQTYFLEGKRIQCATQLL